MICSSTSDEEEEDEGCADDDNRLDFSWPLSRSKIAWRSCAVSGSSLTASIEGATGRPEVADCCLGESSCSPAGPSAPFMVANAETEVVVVVVVVVMGLGEGLPRL